MGVTHQAFTRCSDVPPGISAPGYCNDASGSPNIPPHLHSPDGTPLPRGRRSAQTLFDPSDLEPLPGTFAHRALHHCLGRAHHGMVLPRPEAALLFPGTPLPRNILRRALREHGTNPAYTHSAITAQQRNWCAYGAFAWKAAASKRSLCIPQQRSTLSVSGAHFFF